MLDKLKVKDIYIKLDDYPNISFDAPVGHAIHVMHHVIVDQHKYRTILVLDDEDRLKGYLSMRDLIRAVGPDYLHKKQQAVKGNQPFNFDGLSQDLTVLSLIWQEGFTLKLQDELSKPVSEYMTLMEDQVTLDDPIAKCIYVLLLHDLLVLPVVEDEEVVGVVRLVDIFERIADNVERAWMPKHKGG